MPGNMTNFALLTNEEKTVWAKDVWRQARNQSMLTRFEGKGANSIISLCTELKETVKGARAVITLLADTEGDGVAGDRMLEGNEEPMTSHDQIIEVDQLRHAHRHEGKMANQRSVVDFRENARDMLSYWLADRWDQMGFLTMSGVLYSKKNNGAPRVGSDLTKLEFAPVAADAPSAKRYGRWDEGTKSILWGTGNSTLVDGAVLTGDYPCWELFVQAKAYAKMNYIRGVTEDGGEETYHAFLSPLAMARLKLDPTYLQNLRHSQARDSKNPLYTGSTVKIDGIYLHEHRHVYNTSGASGAVLIAGGGALHSKWGAGGDVDGCQILFCGAQALAKADIGTPDWHEKGFDYDNQQAVALGKISGLLKPKFASQYSGGTVEDFGVLSIYVSQ